MRPVETAEEMLKACQEELPADIAIFAAAVADWRVARIADEKLKKGSAGPPVLALTENPDILKTIASQETGRPQLVIGFAAETQDMLKHAAKKLEKKGCDLIIANDVSAENSVFGGDRNTVHLVSPKGVESWPSMSKRDVAAKLMERLSRMLAARQKPAE